MKIKLYNCDEYWRYIINELSYTQEQYDYVFKYLDFDKLEKNGYIIFNNKETGGWFYKTYINSRLLNTIYNDSPKGYQYLKNNWGNGVFLTIAWYTDKQKIKTIINKLINIELKKIS